MAGSPRAARAVGSACGANGIIIINPCHRITAARGLGGFGSGPAWKRRLLRLEGHDL
jgi:O-6-methylguanine DNA methyltransferase